MTSFQGVLAAFTIILIDLLGRAGLDKVLALKGGPTFVAIWAQLQSIIELVGSVTMAGVLQGLTVLVAQAGKPVEERRLLRDALLLGLGTSLSMALMMMVSAHWLADWLAQQKLDTDLWWLAAWVGCIGVIPATLNAYWLGKHQQHKMLGMALLSSFTWGVVATAAWLGFSLRGLMWAQAVALTAIACGVGFYLYRLVRGYNDQQNAHFHKLVRFVPVGLVIGILSPVSMLLIRGMLSGMLSWSDVGFLQALWRSTEWVTATAAGVFSLIFLPRFSASYGTAGFRAEIMRAGMAVLIPAALLLLIIFLNQRALLTTLYDPRFVVSDETAALIMLGCWIRIASWLFLFSLFAAHRTLLIIAGEFLSLPLFAGLLWLSADGMTLERTAWCYFASYSVYLGFNALALWYALRAKSADRDATSQV